MSVWEVGTATSIWKMIGTLSIAEPNCRKHPLYNWFCLKMYYLKTHSQHKILACGEEGDSSTHTLSILPIRWALCFRSYLFYPCLNNFSKHYNHLVGHLGLKHAPNGTNLGLKPYTHFEIIFLKTYTCPITCTTFSIQVSLPQLQTALFNVQNYML